MVPWCSNSLRVRQPGDVAICVLDGAGEELCQANPLRVVADASLRAFWGDLHGQSEETIGTNSVGSYFAYARDKAFLDIVGHQGNDFQITDEFWERLNGVTSAYDMPGRFVAVPGYEWSGNTGMGGDRNVFFRHEGAPSGVPPAFSSLPGHRIPATAIPRPTCSPRCKEKMLLSSRMSAAAMRISAPRMMASWSARSRCIRPGAPLNGSCTTHSIWGSRRRGLPQRRSQRPTGGDPPRCLPFRGDRRPDLLFHAGPVARRLVRTRCGDATITARREHGCGCPWQARSQRQ